jgi:diadenosine tetraphosphate (Ap4A) HIT family hydrolase
MGTLRTKESDRRYQEAIAAGVLQSGCVLCTKEPISAFKQWKIVNNDFPYDKFAIAHDMIVPLRHASASELTQEEWYELDSIKKTYINERYEWMMESTARAQSIPAHFHLHLITASD